jgi:hypothetical protein
MMKKNIERLLKEQKTLITQRLKWLKETTDENAEIDELEEMFLLRPYPFIDEHLFTELARIRNLLEHKNFQCRFSKETQERLEYMTNPTSGNPKEEEKKALKEIKTFTKGGKELIFIDPYVYGGKTQDAQAHIDDFKICSSIDSSTTKINIIYSSKHGHTTAIKSGIRDLASNHNCTLVTHDSEKIHDRIWIKDGKEAIVVGTSLGGLGKSLAFILPLPKGDLDTLLTYLNNEGMLIQNNPIQVIPKKKCCK